MLSQSQIGFLSENRTNVFKTNISKEISVTKNSFAAQKHRQSNGNCNKRQNKKIQSKQLFVIAQQRISLEICQKDSSYSSTFLYDSKRYTFGDCKFHTFTFSSLCCHQFGSELMILKIVTLAQLVEHAPPKLEIWTRSSVGHTQDMKYSISTCPASCSAGMGGF